MNSRFYYRMTYRGNGATVPVTIDAPFVTNLSAKIRQLGSLVVLADDEGNAQQGLHLWVQDRWRLALPQVDVSLGVVVGYDIDIYYELANPMPVPNGSFVFRNGQRFTGTMMTADSHLIWVVMTPAAGSGTVKSINNVQPDASGNVQLVAADIGAVDLDMVGQPNGVPSLDNNGWIPMSQLPPGIIGGLQYQGLYNASTNTPPLPAPDQSNKGWYWVVSEAGTQQGLELRVGDWIVSNGSSYDKIDNQEGRVLSVNGETPDGDGNITVPSATETVAGTVKIPVDGGLVVEPDGSLTINPEIINNIGFTPIRVLYVALNGDPINGNGKVNNPFTTIGDAVTAATDGTAIVVRTPGSFVENVTIKDKQVALLSEVGSAYNQAPVVIQGFLALDGNRISVQDIGINWGDTGAAFRVTSVGSDGVALRNLIINTTSAAQAVQIDDSDGAWTGQLSIDGLYTNDGKIQIDAGNVSIRMLPEASNSIVEVNGGTVSLTEVQRLQRIDHTNGSLRLSQVQQLGTSSAAPALNSTAPASSSNFLSINDVSTWASSTVQSYINKTGTCQYEVDGLTRNLPKDVWTGVEITKKSRYTQDIIVDRAGVNYAGPIGTYATTHLAGIDAALGTKLGSLSSAGGTSLVDDAAIGRLRGVAAGAGMTITAVNGVLTFSSSSVGGVTSFNGAVGAITLQAGLGLTLSNTGNTFTLAAVGGGNGIQQVGSTTGDGVSLVADDGTTTSVALIRQLVAGNGITLTESDTGVTVETAGGVQSVNGLFGAVQVVGGTDIGVSINADGHISVAYTGSAAGTKVDSLNGLSGPITLDSSNPNITINSLGSTISIDASGFLTSVDNAVVSNPDAAQVIADTGSASGQARAKVLVAGTNVMLTQDNDSVTINAVGGSGTVNSVNNITPQDPLTGNITLDAGDVGALPLAGGSMLGPVNMASNAIKNVPDPVDSGDPMTLGYFSSGDLIIDNGET